MRRPPTRPAQPYAAQAGAARTPAPCRGPRAGRAGLRAALLGLGLAAAAAAGPAGAWEGCPAIEPARVLEQLNALRVRGLGCGAAGPRPGVAPLAWGRGLEAAARRHAEFLAAGGEAQPLVHTGARGEDLRQRLADTGVRYARAAENLARGQGSPAEALAAWAASDGHCVNLMDARVTEAALACVADDSALAVWVLLLGRP